MRYYPQPDSQIRDKVEVVLGLSNYAILGLSNYATKNELEHATGLIHLV